MTKQIPVKWKNAVKTILEAPDDDRVIVTKRAVEEFQALFPLSFSYHLLEAFQKAMEMPGLTGNQIFGMTPEGTTYEFIFICEGRDVYGKVCLTTDNQVVVIFSAHRPLKGTLL